MSKSGVLGISCAALLALTSAAMAGPMSVAPTELVAPPQPNIERAAYYHHHYYRHHYAHRYYRYHRYYAVNPARTAAGLATGAVSLGVGVATLGNCSVYGCGRGYGWY